MFSTRCITTPSTAARALGLVLAISVVVALAASNAAVARPAPITSASAFVLPSARTCVQNHTITVMVRRLRGVRWAGATVSLNGTLVKTIKSAQVGSSVAIRRVPEGKLVLTLTAWTRQGRRVTGTRTLHACSKPTPEPTPKPTPPKPTPPQPTPPQPTPPQQTQQSTPTPGSYSGSSTQDGWDGLSFHVSPDGRHVQDVSMPVVAQGCAPSKSFYDKLAIADIPINADGSFSATTTQDGVLFGTTVHFTYTFRGQFDGTSATGHLREDLTYNDDGTAYSCTSNDQSWSVTRERQGTQTLATQPPGSYSGGSTQDGWDGLSFHVSPDGRHVQDVSMPVVAQGCAPSKSFYDKLAIADIPINADGSFSATTTQDGVLFGTTVHFTYTFRGHFHGLNANDTARAAGQIREDITFDDGTAYSCTSNDQSWSVTRERQGTQTLATQPPGSYSGGSTQDGWDGLSFHVSPDGRHVQDVSMPVVAQGCAPSKSFYDKLAIADIPINADGSFSATTTQTGVLFGATAHFTYTFRGHFHGLDSNNTARAAGQIREDVTFDNGTAYSCTSNDQAWSVTRR